MLAITGGTNSACKGGREREGIEQRLVVIFESPLCVLDDEQFREAAIIESQSNAFTLFASFLHSFAITKSPLFWFRLGFNGVSTRISFQGSI